MASRLSNLLSRPREVLRNIIGISDSPHAIALGVAIGVFYGMTPTVGIQTVFVLITVFLTRRLFYFNAAAAMAATYVSNPITMVPLYYCWYRLGAVFTGGDATMEELEALWNFDDFQGWWQAVQTAGAEIGIPMLVGALITAVVASAIAYPAFYFFLTWLHRKRSDSGSASSRTEKVDSQNESAPESAPKSATVTASASEESATATAEEKSSASEEKGQAEHRPLTA